MKKLFFLTLVSLIAIASNAQKFIINDANAEIRKVGNFSGISVSSAIDLYLTQSDDDAIAVSAKDTESRNRIKTEVVGGVLKIWFDSKGWSWGSGDKKLKAYVSFKNIETLTASGASDISVNGKVSGDGLKLRLSGASDFKGEVDYKNMDIHLSGASDVDIKGNAAALTVDASGASELKGYNLATETCNAEASGASSIKITVNKELSVKASGASDIFYSGTGVIRNVKSSGASNVSKKG